MATRTFTDFDPTFLPHPTTGDLLLRVDDRAIKFAVKSLVLTNFYEKPFHPEIGTSVKSLMFDNFGDMFNIVMSETIANIISIYEPRVTVTSVDVSSVYDEHRANIVINFIIKNTTTPLSVAITLNRTR